MKRFLILLTAAAAAFALGACGEAPAPEESTAQPELQAPEAPRPVSPIGEPVILRFGDSRTQGYDRETGQVPVLTMESSVPRAFMPAWPAAGEPVSQALSGLQKTLFQGDGEAPGYEALLEEARTLRQDLGENFQSWYVGLRTRVTRADPAVLSLRADNENFLGGPHGFTRIYGLSFDPATGERLTLESLSSQPEQLRQAITAEMTALAGSPEFEECLPLLEPQDYAAAFAGLLDRESWYLEEDCLTVYGQEEEFGPHAAGIPLFRIPYEQLQPWLKPEYLPPEKAYEGEMALELPVGCNARIIDDLTLDDQGEVLLLNARGAVKDVWLLQAEYGEQGIRATKPIWYSSEMEDTVLRLQVTLPDTAPNLMLCYTSGGEVHRLLPARSGRDGSLMFLDPDSL